MHLAAVFTAIMAIFLATGAAHLKPKSSQQEYDARRCAPKLLKERPRRGVDERIHIGKGEKYKNSPVVAFQIQESGEVTNVVLKRSSGVANIDAHALASIRGLKFNKRPGCGVVESQGDVLIHFR